MAIAVILFCVIQFWIIPAKQARQNEYALNQTDALTHDISAIENCKSSYVGDANNTANLFYSLPLCDISMKFQIDSETCALTVNYLDTVWNIGEEKVQRDLIYNSVAAMAAIDNLSEITYEFSGDSYSFDREQMEDMFGSYKCCSPKEYQILTIYYRLCSVFCCAPISQLWLRSSNEYLRI